MSDRIVDLAYAPLTITDIESVLQRRWEQTGHTFDCLVACSRPIRRILSTLIPSRHQVWPVSVIETHFGPLTVYASEGIPNDRIELYEDIRAEPIVTIVNFDCDPMSYPRP